MKNTISGLTLPALLLVLGALGLKGAQGPASYETQRLASVSGSGAEVAHVGVDVGRIAMLQTSQVRSGLSSTLYFDGFWNAPFSVPDGYTFVATELVIAPYQTGTPPTIYGYLWVNGYLSYPLQHVGDGVTTIPLGAGIVIRPEDTPTVHAYTGSTHTFKVTITGYFVKGDARTPGEPFQG